MVSWVMSQKWTTLNKGSHAISWDSSPKNFNSVIIYSPSCHFKPVWFFHFILVNILDILKNVGTQTVNNCLSCKDLEIVIHALISSRLDYCNSLYIGLPQSTLSRLQMVQNAAARFLTGTKKRDHITPVLASLHWLPIKLRVDFKVLLFAYKALHNSAPDYICDLIKPYTASRSLRSSDQLLLSVPRSRCKTKGDRAFSVVAPKLWNSLPLNIRASPSLDAFKSSLKTYFYSLAF